MSAKRPMLWNHNRTCTKCFRSRPSAGAITSPKFICADCRQRIERKRAARRMAQPTAECSP